jgi:LacI family transcriptional regulator
MRQSSKVSDSVTIVDVAREAGVSYATVSRVVNGKAHVKPDKRERVLRAMTRLGYVANQQARSLAGGRSHVVGLLVPDLGTGYIGEIVRGIDQELERFHYDLMLYTTHRRRAKEASYVAALSRGLADGLLLVLPRDPASYLPALQQRRVPYVLVDHNGIDRTGPAVGASNWQGGYDATRHLIELGHRRIGFIAGTLDLTCSTDRRAGYLAAMHDAGLAAPEDYLRVGDFLQPSGYLCTRELLALAEPPTAIFASNDVMAFGAMEAAREQGLHIPSDISIVGFDDIAQAAHVHPPLTTVRQPLEEMGRTATRMLVEMIENPQQPPARAELPTQLVVRRSTQPLP